jgi:hypothetical protein
MAKKQVHTMAKAEKVAPGSDWHIPLRTADAEVWLQENGRVHTPCRESLPPLYFAPHPSVRSRTLSCSSSWCLTSFLRIGSHLL